MPKMPQGIEPGQRQAHAFALAASGGGGKADGPRLDLADEAAQGVLGACLEEMAHALLAPHVLHAGQPLHRALVEIDDVAADVGLLRRIEARGDAAHQGRLGRVHLDGAEHAVGEASGHAHLRVVEGELHVEHHGGMVLPAQGAPCLGKLVAGPGEDELVRRVVVGHQESWPGGLHLVEHLLAGVDGHHPAALLRLLLELGHELGTGVHDEPAGFGRIDAGKAQGDELAQGMSAEEGRLEAKGAEEGELGVLEQKEVGLLPAGEAEDVEVGLVHEREHVPAGAGCQPVHGLAAGREAVVELAAHAGPHAALAAADKGKLGLLHGPRRQKDALGFKGGQLLRRGAGRSRHALHPARIDRPHAPEAARLLQGRVADAVQADGLLSSHCAARLRVFLHRRSGPWRQGAVPS